MEDGATYVVGVPAASEYCRLRALAGLTPRSLAAATAGLPNTVVGIVVRRDEDLVGMGRVVGDGLFYQLVDIAVDPACRGRGIGRNIVSRLMQELRSSAPAEAYVSLIADGKADQLYASCGFSPTAPASIGMAQWIGEKTVSGSPG